MAGLGSTKNPLIMRVRTKRKAAQLIALCQDNGWHAIVGVEFWKRQDITDLKKKLEDQPLCRLEPKHSRNEPCPCGSGKKYKKCCLPMDEAE